MASPALFQPIELASLKLDNRIVVAPMCQYSATDGCMNDWHFAHLARLLLSGAAGVTIEATAVLPDGRISDKDLGLWDATTATAAAKIVARLKAMSDTPLFVQLSHAGRKASVEVPWLGGGQIAPPLPRGWTTRAPSPVALRDTDAIPNALDKSELADVRDAFATAAARAMEIGLDGVQIHAAHGYLLHQFLSPLANQRTDEYGGDLATRMRFPLEVIEAVRGAVPASKPLTVRISATDWVDGGWEIEQTIAFVRALRERGCTAVHISTGGLHPAQQIPVGPSYQVPFARAVKAAVDIPVIAVGLITEPEQAEAIIATGDADLVALARGILYDPHWPWHAAAALGGQVRAPNQYLRSQPRLFLNLLRPAQT
ncbi:NADH:flavin oxidoreductase/NADH oxidase [Novosphingobium sp. PP1Y]|uniref:NADH:flavin oxidoreductase/NADH oxidase n=1 Tax=Novosphingobium sp. PP1Y TaxID=702113 RepID=UPI00020EF8E2|nr:NADH:flavin oxidoreductase/NADH oxidase [Novosphingobium sp. PP1Y]CCA90754.1 NADH:flavin oxidoreductase/NADH oxidase [Novosphingobium sp. PP1Y]